MSHNVKFQSFFIFFLNLYFKIPGSKNHRRKRSSVLNIVFSKKKKNSASAPDENAIDLEHYKVKDTPYTFFWPWVPNFNIQFRSVIASFSLEVFGFPIWYNGEFEIFFFFLGGGILKNQTLIISKISHTVLWWPLGKKFRGSYRII